MASSLVRRLGMAVAATVLGLGLLNLLASAGEVAAYGTWYRRGQPVGLYASAEGERPRLRPGASLRGLLYHIEINSLGFRGPELVEPRPARSLRLWCLGGSTTFDIYAPDDASAWPALTAVRLQQALGRPVDVLNAGVPGEVLEGSLADLRALGQRVRPDFVVIYHGPNDLRQILAGHSLPPPTPGAWLPPLPDLALFRVSARLLQSSSYLQVSLPAREVQIHHLAPVRQRLLALIQAARAAGAVPVLATHALRAPPDAAGEEARALVAESAVLLGIDPESTLRAFGGYNALVAEIARAEGLPLADVRGAVPPDAENWGDATHFRAPGSARAAQAVSDAILAALPADGVSP